MTDSSQEYSKHGDPIFHHEPIEPPKFEQSLQNPAQREIDEHIDKYFGDIKNIFHEIIPVKIHVDIYISEPTNDRNYYSIITSGMSTLPMKAPGNLSGCKYSELFLCLPANWNINQNAQEDENNYWPFRCLKVLARFPHDYKTWLWDKHTIPNENPIKPFSNNTKLCCSMLSTPKRIDANFYKLRINKDKTIYFHSIIPLYMEEMNYKLKHGAEGLLKLLNSNGVNELLDINRKSVIKKKIFGFI
jgi:hypothetical protein